MRSQRSRDITWYHAIKDYVIYQALRTFTWYDTWSSQPTKLEIKWCCILEKILSFLGFLQESIEIAEQRFKYLRENSSWIKLWEPLNILCPSLLRCFCATNNYCNLLILPQNKVSAVIISSKSVPHVTYCNVWDAVSSTKLFETAKLPAKLSIGECFIPFKLSVLKLKYLV